MAKNKAKAKTVSNADSAAPMQVKPPKVKARPDLYTLLLGLSVAVLAAAVTVLFLNYYSYGGDPLSGLPTPPSVPSLKP